MPLTVETDKRNLNCNEVQQSQVSSSRPFLFSSLEPCVFEALKTSLLLLRVDGSVQFASRCVHDVLGISQEEIIGKHMRDFVLRDDYCRFEQCLLRLAEVQRIYDGRAAAPNDAITAASALSVEQTHSAVPQGPGDSASQNQLLVVPEFKKQIFTCRVRRLPDGPPDARRAAREYFDAEVTAFARWCSADEEVGGVENAARILGDPHKQLCLFCVLKRCVSVSHVLPASYAEASFSSQLRPPSGQIASGESSSLIELLTSDASASASSFAFETDPQSFYQLGFGAFDSCGPPVPDAYVNTSMFDSVLNGVASDAPAVGADCFFGVHTDLANAPTPTPSLRFVAENAEAPRLKSPLTAPISRTPTPTTPGPRLHGPLTFAPSQLAIVPANTGRTTPQHGRPSGGSESKKLRELLLKGSTGTPDTPDALTRSSRSCSVEMPQDPVPLQAIRRGSLGIACNDPVAPSPPLPRTAMSTPTPIGLAPSKLESVSGWQKDTKVLRSGGQQSILIQLLNTDEPNVKRDAESQLAQPPPANANAGAVSSSAAVTSTTTSLSRVRAKRGSVKESYSVVAAGSLPATGRISATKRTASLPLEELLDSDATSCSDTPISVTATATASNSPSVTTKLAGIVQSVTHTTAYPLRGVPQPQPQPQFGAVIPRGADQSLRPASGQTELEKLLCDTSHAKSPDPPRHASGEPTTTTGTLNAPASTSAAQSSQAKRAPRKTRNRSGANPNGQPPATVQPQQTADANAALNKTLVKRRSTTGTIGELLSAPSPVQTQTQTQGRYPPIGSMSQTSSVEQNEVANMLYDFSDTSEQMQNTRTFSDISAPLSVGSKRNSAAATLPKAAKLEVMSNADTGDDLDDSSNLPGYTARSLADGDSSCGAAPYGGALMTLLTSNSPPDQFAAPRSNSNANPVWTPGATYPPSNAGVSIACEMPLGSNAQRPISNQTNAVLSHYVRSKQRAFSATGLQPNTEPDSVPPQFVASPSNSIYQQLGVNNPASVSVAASDGTLEQMQSQPLASNSSVMFARVEPLGDLGPGLMFEHTPFTPASSTFTLDVNCQPIGVTASGQPVLIGANGLPVPIGPYTPGPAVLGAPPRMAALMRPPPPSYQMTTGAMQLTQPTHISDNYVSSTTSGFDVSTGLVSSTISPSQSLSTPTMRLTTPNSLQQAQVSQPQSAQRQDVLAAAYPQLSAFQLTPMPSCTPQTLLTHAIAPFSDPLARHFAPESGMSAAAASQPDDISLYLDSLSTSELDLLINSVTVTLPPPPSPCTTASPNIPLAVASNTSVQFVGSGNAPFQPQYASVGTPNSLMQLNAYPMPPPSAMSAQTPRPSAPAPQFYAAAPAQLSPAMQPTSATTTPLLTRANDTPNVRLPADQSALLRAAIDQSGLPPSAFGITAPPLQPAGASPRTSLASPIRRNAPNMLVASQAINQQHQVLGAGSDAQMVMGMGMGMTHGNPVAHMMMPPASTSNQHMLGVPSNSQSLVGASSNGQTMLADVTHSAAQNQPDVLSGSKLAELMKANVTVPPNVTLPPGTHIQIPLQSGSATGSTQAPARISQTTQQLTGAGAPAAQQKAGLIASQIVKEAELRQQQAAQSQAGLLQQLQARSKMRPDQSELASVLASPPERPSQLHGPTGGSVTPSAFGSGAGPPPPSMFASARPQGSVLASLISSPVHSPVVTGAPPSAFVSSASAPVLACASNSATAVATALLQPVVYSRLPHAPTRTASQPQTQPTPPNRFASPLSATPTQQSPVASSNTNANNPSQSASTSAQPSGSSQTELTDEIIETVEQLTQTHRSRLSRRSGSRSSVGETKPADPQRPPKRHDSMLERLLAEND